MVFYVQYVQKFYMTKTIFYCGEEGVRVRVVGEDKKNIHNNIYGVVNFDDEYTQHDYDTVRI